MTTTFLHEDKVVPPDEAVDARPPACPACGKPMWLINFTRRASDDGVQDKRNYECKMCGAALQLGAGD